MQGDAMLHSFGARNAVGLGLAAVQWSGTIREEIQPAANVPSDIALPGTTLPDVYTDHLRTYRDEILQLLEATA